MDVSRFYGTHKKVNPIPGDGSISEDELASDSDSEYIPPSTRRNENKRKLVVIPETDSSESEDGQAYQSHSKKSTLNKQSKSKQTKVNKVIWTLGKMPSYDQNQYPFKGNCDLPKVVKDLHTPADFFSFLFTDDLINYIVEQSNTKALQDNVNKPSHITKQEMEKFIGIVIYMSLVKLPSSRMYWSKSVGQASVYEVMPCNRWEKIKQYLHFNNNTNFKPYGTPGYDKLYKVRPLLDMIRERCLLIPKEEYLAVDEQIIPTKARHEIKQYNPAKPHKWGYKNQVLSGVSGFSYDFDIFAGEQSNTYPQDAPNLGVSANVVTRLTSTVPRGLNFKIFFDNWFNSPNLQVYLFKNGLLPLGTVRLNRVPNSNMPTENNLKKEGRGSMTEKLAVIDGVKLSLVTWYDNKPVNMLSAYVGSEPVTTKSRFFKKEKVYKEISSPQAVDVYNHHMGGVDLLDSLLGLYRIQLRSVKWYKKIFYHMIDLCIVNAWLLWRRCNDEMYLPLYDFKLAVAEHLCKAGKAISRKRGRPSKNAARTPGTPTSNRVSTPTSSHVGTPTSSRACTPTSSRIGTPTSNSHKLPRKRLARQQDVPLMSVRMDTIDHFPKWMKTRQLCQNNCTYRSYTMCEKCKVFLCYNDKRNCFKNFHC